MASRDLSLISTQRKGRRPTNRRSNAGSITTRDSSLTVTLPTIGPTISVFGSTDPLAGGSLNYSYQLADLSQVSTYATLYSMYRINFVEIEFCPTANMSAMINATEPPGGVNPAYYVPCIHTAIDFDSTASPLNAATLMGYRTYRRSFLDRPIRRRLPPMRCQLAAQNASPVASLSGAILPTSAEQWYSTDQPLLRFGNLLVFIDPVSNGSVALTPSLVRTYVRMNVTFFNLK